jgi:LmbE family N-acetylglucosaminyl deacetylase
MADVLVVAPHPDDDVIGCGGSIIKHVKAGKKVKIAYVTSGDAGSLKYTKEELGRMREEEAPRGANILGVPADQLVFLRAPDGYVEFHKQDLLIQMASLIRSERPGLVYVPHAKDAHKDHIATHEITVEAVGRAAAPCFQECPGKPWSVEQVLGYEVWTPLAQVGYVEDISDCIEQKLAALREHKTQLENYQFDAAIQGLNRYRGVMTGKGTFVECFERILG